MSKFLIFADLHIHNYKQFNKDNSRLTNCLNVLDDIFETASATGINTILFPGDLFDSQKALPIIVVNQTIKKFIQLFEKHPHVNFVACSGNHDYGSKNLIDKPAVSALTHLAEVFIDRFILIDNTFVDIDNVRIHAVPYYEYSDHYHDALEKRTFELLEPQTDLLMIHQTPDGISNTSFAGDTDPDSHLYGYFQHIFCGHIHKREYLSNKFTVVGSPLHRDLGDVGETKGFLIYDSTNNIIEFVALENYPEFIKVDDTTDAAYNNDYAVQNKLVVENTSTIDLDSKKFNTNLKAEQLVENFWLEADGEDKDLLSVGLSFIK